MNIVHLIEDQNLGGINTFIGHLLDHFKHTNLTSHVMLVNPEKPWAKCLKANVVVIHFASRWRCVPFLISLKALNPQARILLIEHHYCRSNFNESKSPFRLRTLLKTCYRLVDCVVSVSVEQHRWLCELEHASNKYFAGVSRPLTQLLTVSKKSAIKTLRIGAIGYLQPVKGFDVLINAVKKVKKQWPDMPFQLNIAGEGPMRSDLSDQAADMAEVSFVGQINHVKEFLNETDIVVIPSRSETFSLVCLEARAAGCWVIGSNVDGLRSQLNSSQLFPVGDDDALASKIIAASSLDLQKIAREQQSIVKDHWHDCLKRWERCLVSKV